MGFWPEPTDRDRASFADAEVRPVWREGLAPRDPYPALEGTVSADLCIVGGGFTGLWAAAQYDGDCVVLEGEVVGFGGSGRNGGFTDASLTHGLPNGLARFASEMPEIERLAAENWDGYRSDLSGID